MPLRWKIWLSVFGIVTGLFGVAGWMLQRHAVESATLSLEEEVTAGFQAYESVLKARQEMIGSAALLLSSLPNVRAAFGTGDPATIRDSATEMGSYLSPVLKESAFLGSSLFHVGRRAGSRSPAMRRADSGKNI